VPHDRAVKRLRFHGIRAPVNCKQDCRRETGRSDAHRILLTCGLRLERCARVICPQQICMYQPEKPLKPALLSIDAGLIAYRKVLDRLLSEDG
jgi:hypothetical protein